jgi:hypothetical protein
VPDDGVSWRESRWGKEKWGDVEAMMVLALSFEGTDAHSYAHRARIDYSVSFRLELFRLFEALQER